MAASPTLSFLSASDDEAQSLLSRYAIGLTVEEARNVETMLGRPLSLTEAVIWGIQGSEHCSYKSSRRFLKTLPTDGAHVILGPKEDAGIVAITDGPPGKRWGIAIGHESHNHPSQIVPYEGAATGIGGCVRDVLCMGARVIGCLDALRLGDLSTVASRSIAKEVARGIAGYGNPLGIPNLGGDAVFSPTYNANCLVNAVTVGIVREDEVIHSIVPEEAAREKYDIILIGKATDRSGFGGAAFASLTMDEEKREQNTGAVQEPNPFLERHLLASTYDLFDGLARDGLLSKVSFKDLGAGGVVCASVEQVDARGFGAVVDLDKVHVALPDLPPEVIACAETQERFCWTCHPSLTERILAHYNKEWNLPSVAENARASVIGTVTDGGEFILLHGGTEVCRAPASCITSGLQYVRPTAKREREEAKQPVSFADGKATLGTASLSLEDVFLGMLRDPSLADHSPITVHYDKNVIGNTLIERGEADAGVIMPLADLQSYVHGEPHPGWELSEQDARTGVAFAVAGNGGYGSISPYLQGANAVAKAMRSVAAVGATPRALTDCLNYGNPEIPEQLWELEEGVRGIADAARGILVHGEHVPIISGNVSLYNSTPSGSSIDPTAIVSCVGMIKDATRARDMRLKEAGSSIVLLGMHKNECGASAYHHVLAKHAGVDERDVAGSPPSPDFALESAMIACVTGAIDDGLVLSSKTIAEGGLLSALFLMTLPQRKTGGAIGAAIDLRALASDENEDVLLFSETGGFLLEVREEHIPALSSLAASTNCPLTVIGHTTDSSSLSVTGRTMTLLDVPLSSCTEAWHAGLSEAW